MSTIKVNKIENTATADGGIAIDASGHVTVDGQQLPTAGALSGRNRIINGDMRIDQRNAGAAVTSGFPLDRWQIELFDGGGAANVEQVVDSPTDSFYYSMKVDVTTADTSLAATDAYTVRQIIEGNNVVDLRYGLTGAKTVTVSFWVKSNLTGTFCAALRNGDNDRCKPKEYTISSANTWEKKTLTFTGDTSGTWGRTNGRGIQLSFCLGSGSNRQGTADTWNTSEIHCTSNQTNLFASTSNEWYVTGVQLEVGEKATPFEHRSFGDELARCQRYYYRITGSETSTSNQGIYGIGFSQSSTAGRSSIQLPVTMRTFPEALEQSGTASHYRIIAGASGSINCSAVPTFTSSSTKTVDISWTVASGATANQGVYFMSNSASSYIGVSAEL